MLTDRGDVTRGGAMARDERSLAWMASFAALVLIAAAGCAEESLPSLVDLSAPGCDAGVAGCGPCTSDAQCAGATPRCDKNSGRCVDCLPLHDNCPRGQRCLPRGAGYFCTMACVEAAECPAGTGGAPGACCNGGCVDTATNASNCGSCGKVCAPLPNAEPGCAAGSCVRGPCNLGFADCDKDAANGCEANIAADAKNCGGCGKACPVPPGVEATCAGGVCGVGCRAGSGDCDGDPGNGCETDIAANPKSCGACGMVCLGGANAMVHCANGKCQSTCGQGYADCDNNMANGCNDLNNEVNNCGACNVRCQAVPNGSPACRAGMCRVGSCSLGFVDCNGMIGDGCEASSLADPSNCGKCGKVCAAPNSSQACKMGMCIVTSCGMGYADCDGLVDNGCEVPTGSDARNCGGCGKACPVPPNTSVGCADGRCTVAGCSPGWGDCNLDPSDGCEGDLTTPVNCGRCGVACGVPPNGMAACKAGACAVTGCDALWGDCDSQFANGCEKSLAGDPAHCGACGKACSLTNAVSGCANGQCTVTSCNAGFGDCDGNPANGCESNAKADSRNCGKCGVICPMNAPLCVGGVCSAAGKVALCYAENNGNVATTVAAGINPNGQFAGIDLVNCGVGVPSLNTLLQYRALLVWDSLKFFDRTALGNVLADYVEAGGGVVLAEFAMYIINGNGWDLQGRWLSGNGGAGYGCLKPGDQALAILSNAPNDANSPLVAGVMGLSAQNTGIGGLLPGARSVWDFQGGVPAIATCNPAGHKRVDLNFYPNPAAWSGDGYVMMRNALLYVSN